MTYITHKERLTLIYIAAVLAVALIIMATAAHTLSADPLATCTAKGLSADTCAYALR